MTKAAKKYLRCVSRRLLALPATRASLLAALGKEIAERCPEGGFDDISAEWRAGTRRSRAAAERERGGAVRRQRAAEKAHRDADRRMRRAGAHARGVCVVCPD